MKKNYLLSFSIFIVLLYILSFHDQFASEEKKFMKKAALNMQSITALIKEEKIKRGILIDPNLDPNLTGLIGEEFTEITTTLGNLESKRTSVNPDFAALFVKILKKNNIKKGDKIAVNMSSSFPGLNLSLISALDLLEIEAIIINSIGASTYGANNIDFNYLDMEDFLLDKKAIKNHSTAYSLGGDNDLGKNFQDDWEKKLIERKDNRKRSFFYTEDIKENVENRMQFYKKHENIKMFISIGGNLVSELLIKNFKEEKIPTVVFLNIKHLASLAGIPIDAVPFPEIGTSSLYKKKNNFFVEYFIVISFILYLIFLYLRKKGYNYIKTKSL